MNRAALAALKSHGITPAQWITEHGNAGQWTGDTCGCPDDRCAGHHHDEGADCMCLAILVAEYIDEAR